MKKKILYILFAAFFASLFSLTKYNQGSFCDPNSSYPCIQIPSSRGYPIPIILETGSFDNFFKQTPLLFFQLWVFILNVGIYFLFFSAIYFGYSKLTNKAKKK